MLRDMPSVFRRFDGRYYKANSDAELIGEYRSAGIIHPDHIEDIKAVTILDELLGLARPLYKLREICRPVPMSRLQCRVDIATALAGVEKVPPMIEATITKEAYTSVDFDLWKNVVHIAVADETEMRTVHDILGTNTADAARDIARMENKQIAEAVDACDNQQAAAGGSVATHTWDTSTGGVSDANPFVDLLIAFNAIEADGFLPDYVVMHPNVWAGFITNTFVKDLLYAGVVKLTGDGSAKFTVPGYPTVAALTDHAVTPITCCYVMSKSAPGLVLGKGPTAAAKYRDEKAGYDAYIIRDWLQPQIIDFGTGLDAVIDITGVHS